MGIGILNFPILAMSYEIRNRKFKIFSVINTVQYSNFTTFSNRLAI